MTAFSDTFTQPDGTSVPGWVEVAGDWAISSNRLAAPASGGTGVIMPATAMSTDDNSAQVTISVVDAVSCGVVCRSDSAFGNGYLWRNDGTSWDLFRNASGTFTSLGTFPGAAVDGDVAKVQAVGTTIKGFVNGVERVSVTDTGITTGKNTGIRCAASAAVRLDDYTAADVGGASTVTATIAQDFGALGGGVSGTREVLASVSQSVGGLGGGVTATRETFASVSGAMGPLAGGVTIPPPESQLKPATSLVVAMAWLRTIPAIADIVASDLPAVEKWASPNGHGFVTVGPVVGGGGASPLMSSAGVELYAPLRHPIVQVDFWAAFANSKKINHGVAQANAEAVWNACYSDEEPAVTLPAAVRPVHLTPIYPVSPDVLGPIPDPNNYAHYQIALHVGWIHQGSIPGVTG